MQNTSNENGRPLIDFAQEKNMVIISTEFLQKMHKATWVSPDRQAKNQNDHIIMDRRQDTSITYIRTYRGASYDSDHYLVKGMYRVRM